MGNKDDNLENTAYRWGNTDDKWEYTDGRLDLCYNDIRNRLVFICYHQKETLKHQNSMSYEVLEYTIRMQGTHRDPDHKSLVK